MGGIKVSISEREKKYETERMNITFDVLDRKIHEINHIIKNQRKLMVESRKKAWEEMPHIIRDYDELYAISQTEEKLAQEEENYITLYRTRKTLEKMRQNPYFGRVDFKDEDFSSVDQIYIGIATLMDENEEFLIYDWRAPICSIFYDYEPGKVQYRSPEGIVRGEMLLKRQYKFVDGKLLYMFNSSVKVDDDILQEILSQSTDEKMKIIVNTIQKEQNKIIRDEDYRVLAVQGSAGSGKTSIALHRAAYLLYKYRDKITSRNILIFSPNDVFNDYISDVLPELGEEKLRQTTFTRFIRRILPKDIYAEDMNDQMEYILSGQNALQAGDTCENHPDYEYKARIESIKFKQSPEFLKLIKAYINYIDNRQPDFEDAVFDGDVVMSREEIQDFYSMIHKSLPLARRLNNIKAKIISIVEPMINEKQKQFENEIIDNPDYSGYLEDDIKKIARNKVREALTAMEESVKKWADVNVFKLYMELFSRKDIIKDMKAEELLPDTYEMIADSTVNILKSGKVPYEDASAIAYMKAMLKGVPNNEEIKHLIIDEAQDYTLMQYEIIRAYFPYSAVTLLGDMNQSIHPYIETGSYEPVLDILKEKKSAIIKLTKSYRSTCEIVEFTKAIVKKGEKIDAISRAGEKPQVIAVQDEAKLIDEICKDIEKLKEEGCASIAVICRTAGEASDVFEQLKKKTNAIMIKKDDTEFRTGVVVIPSYLSKGLEFDAVIVYNAGNGNYFNENERKLIYTVCTRALHRLHVFYSGSLSGFIKEIPSELYESRII